MNVGGEGCGEHGGNIVACDSKIYEKWDGLSPAFKKKRKRTQSEPKTSSPHHCTQWFSRKLRCSTKEQQPTNHSLSHLHTPSPPFCSFCPLLYSPHHFTAPSLPTSLCPSPAISGRLGLLFMASPIEDALLYKTLEPSSRPTPFEDVAHNSYLGL